MCDGEVVGVGAGSRVAFAQLLLETDILRDELFALVYGGIKLVKRDMQSREQGIPLETCSGELLTNDRNLVRSLGDIRRVGVLVVRSVARVVVVVLDCDTHREVQLQ